jgi:membrane-bound metal-dependent hydrolase YbcI (DUF457 family)
MQKKTHLAFGLMLASIFFYLGMEFQYVLLVGFISFFPDIDWLIDKLWLKEDSTFKKVWFRILKSKSIHRTFLHNIWIMFALIVIFGLISRDLLTMFGVFIGYFSHLLLDSLTVSGVYWLWPYGDERIFGKKKFYKNGRFVTGDLKEKILFVFFIATGGLFLGLGFYKIQPTGQDAYQSAIIILIFLILGFVLIQRLTKGISIATSRMFKFRYYST